MRATQRAFERAHAIEVAMCERNVLIRVLHAIDFAIDRGASVRRRPEACGARAHVDAHAR